MWNRIRLTVVLCSLVAAVGCGSQPAAPTAPTAVNDANDATLSNLNGTAKETLTGPALNGVAPEGQALADQSKYLTGASTTLTVQVKKVNLPDGTVLNVTLDFTPVGTIRLSRQEGTLVTSLGHFAVSRDQVRVLSGSTVILAGGYFQ